MKRISLTICAVVFGILVLPNVSHALDTTKLQMDMSRAEVVKILGKPVTTEKAGDVEILTFEEVSDRRPLFGSNSPNRDTRLSQMVARTAVFWVQLKANRVVKFGDGMLILPPRERDVSKADSSTIKILRRSEEAENNRVEVESFRCISSKAGAPHKYKMRVAYSHTDVGGANLEIYFVSTCELCVISLGKQEIEKGSGSLEIEATITPLPDWEGTRFRICTVKMDKSTKAPLHSVRLHPQEVFFKY